MKLANFEIIRWIELQSGTVSWDMHNTGNFESLELHSADNSAVMTWIFPEGTVKLRFRGLKFLHVTNRDPELPITEDTCVASISKVETNSAETNPLYRTRNDWGLSEEFRLFFGFQSDRTIEIESEIVELIAPVSAQNAST